MGSIVLIEPHPDGHRFQAVAHVAQVARRRGAVILLTSRGAQERPEFGEFLAGAELRVEEVFDVEQPPTRQIAGRLADLARSEAIDVAVVMDADQSLKRWWLDAPRAFGLRRRPRIVFMLTRYPATLRLGDLVGWRLRIPKAVLALAAMASGSLHRVAGFAGRDDMSTGWIVKRARDPAVCGAHSRDRAALRVEHDLPADRIIIGIFGGVSERKFPELVWEAMRSVRLEADLLLAGGLSPGVAAWVETVEPTPAGRIIVRDGFLPNLVLDQLVAASDAAALIMTNNGPSGIMGKALAAGVPVVTAGSQVRAREVRATGGGLAADFDAESIGAAFAQVLASGRPAGESGAVPLATAEEFAETLLGPSRGR